jgi:hypothetical protein
MAELSRVGGSSADATRGQANTGPRASPCGETGAQRGAAERSRRGARRKRARSEAQPSGVEGVPAAARCDSA